MNGAENEPRMPLSLRIPKSVMDRLNAARASQLYPPSVTTVVIRGIELACKELGRQGRLPEEIKENKRGADIAAMIDAVESEMALDERTGSASCRALSPDAAR